MQQMRTVLASRAWGVNSGHFSYFLSVLKKLRRENYFGALQKPCQDSPKPLCAQLEPESSQNTAEMTWWVVPGVSFGHTVECKLSEKRWITAPYWCPWHEFQSLHCLWDFSTSKSTRKRTKIRTKTPILQLPFKSAHILKTLFDLFSSCSSDQYFPSAQYEKFLLCNIE